VKLQRELLDDRECWGDDEEKCCYSSQVDSQEQVFKAGVLICELPILP